MPKREPCFLRPSGGRVVVKRSAAAAIRKYCKRAEPEAGGVLLGRLIIDSSDIIIDEVTKPQPQDKRSWYQFWRSKEPHQKLVDEAWRRSNGTRIYLGEWHCHPEPDPTPSNEDKKNWRRIVREAKFEQDVLLFIIAGQKVTRVWELRLGEKMPVELAPVSAQ